MLLLSLTGHRHWVQLLVCVLVKQVRLLLQALTLVHMHTNRPLAQHGLLFLAAAGAASAGAVAAARLPMGYTHQQLR
jgi:hypothetical protein